MDDDLLARLERYYDEAPRANADTEEHGPFTVFVSRGGWPYYARPRLGLSEDVTPEDVSSVLARLEALGVPQSIEWVHDDHAVACARPRWPPGSRSATTRCSSSAASRSCGRARSPYAGSRPTTRTSPPCRPRSTSGSARTTRRSARPRWLSATLRATEPDSHVDTISAMIAAGRTVTFGAFDPELGAVGGGSHNPRGEVTEVVGVAVLPAHRRRGIAGHLTWALAADAAEAGARTVFMSAGSDDVARVYEGVGFRRVGTACIVG